MPTDTQEWPWEKPSRAEYIEKAAILLDGDYDLASIAADVAQQFSNPTTHFLQPEEELSSSCRTKSSASRQEYNIRVETYLKTKTDHVAAYRSFIMD